MSSEAALRTLPLLFLDDLSEECGRGDDPCDEEGVVGVGVCPRVGVAGTMSRLSMSESGLLLSTGDLEEEAATCSREGSAEGRKGTQLGLGPLP